MVLFNLTIFYNTMKGYGRERVILAHSVSGTYCYDSFRTLQKTRRLFSKAGLVCFDTRTLSVVFSPEMNKLSLNGFLKDEK